MGKSMRYLKLFEEIDKLDPFDEEIWDEEETVVGEDLPINTYLYITGFLRDIVEDLKYLFLKSQKLPYSVKSIMNHFTVRGVDYNGHNFQYMSDDYYNKFFTLTTTARKGRITRLVNPFTQGENIFLQYFVLIRKSQYDYDRNELRFDVFNNGGMICVDEPIWGIRTFLYENVKDKLKIKWRKTLRLESIDPFGEEDWDEENIDIDKLEYEENKTFFQSENGNILSYVTDDMMKGITDTIETYTNLVQILIITYNNKGDNRERFDDTVYKILMLEERLKNCKKLPIRDE